jgi:hypothetical protein
MPADASTLVAAYNDGQMALHSLQVPLRAMGTEKGRSAPLFFCCLQSCVQGQCIVRLLLIIQIEMPWTDRLIEYLEFFDYESLVHTRSASAEI